MDEIQDRISLIISTKGMSNAEFAEAIDVQPSNISHIMSGRNKPSLDLVMKVLKRFPEIRTEWLLHGKGAMNKDYNLFDATEVAVTKKPDLFDTVDEKIENTPKEMIEEKDSMPGFAEPAERKEESTNPTENRLNRNEEMGWNEPKSMNKNMDFMAKSGKNEKKLDKIVFFYSDKTFNEYYPSEE